MIHIYFTLLSHPVQPQVVQQCKSQLPLYMQQKMERFHQPGDQLRYVWGKALLQFGCRQLGYANNTLSQLTENPFGKPFFAHGPVFNIAHSGDVVVCGIATGQQQFGIDVEAIKPIDTRDFHHLFTPLELQQLQDPEDYAAFYHLWTRKEALVKALGTGLTQPLNQVCVSGDTVSFNNQTFYLHNIAQFNGHACHIATSLAHARYRLHPVFF